MAEAAPSATTVPSPAVSPPPPQEAGGGGGGGGTTTERNNNVAKIVAQSKKLTEANTKYKNLLKLAKERIQQQEESIRDLQEEKESLEERFAALEEEREAAASKNLLLEGDGTSANERSDVEINIVRVIQRVKARVGEMDEIWALIELEMVSNEMADMIIPPRRLKEWKKFDTESELQDYIRRDTGEPLTLPPYSLSPDQSAEIQSSANEQVTRITEEFRRFRVRSELARKQADAQIRELQNSHVQSATRRIEGQGLEKAMENARTADGQLERMKAELAVQEAQWKEAYDVILAENNSLKSSGSEALLASQWRKRYENCLKEKEELQSRLQAKMSSATGDENEATFEAKYRDLKESFRLYRKKAKEIFEAQQNPAAMPFSVGDSTSADGKLSYLKNLMFNYLTADTSVRDHMEGAIGTVLQFTPEEISLVEKKKEERESWFA